MGISSITAILIATFVICSTPAFAEEIVQPTNASDLRLPMEISPLSYQLRVKTWLPGYVPIPAEKNLTFDAQVLIKLRIDEPTNKIVLNAKNLKIELKDIHVTLDGIVTIIKSLTHQPDFEKIIIKMARSLNVGNDVNLMISYSGFINDNLRGLYRSTYTTDNGSQKIMAITQMEPADARQLVPCFDEPYYKAKWVVSIIHPKGTVAVSNGIEIRTEEWVYPVKQLTIMLEEISQTSIKQTSNKSNKSNKQLVAEKIQPAFQYWRRFPEDSFKEMPPMSSYLLAIMVSEFEYLEKYTASGVRFRVWSRPEEQNALRYGLDAGVKTLEHYEKLFNISFPLDKQDMLAIPDFSGAMENWGMVTYSEGALIYHEKFYTSEQKRWVAKVVAHELAHMWFGNLVTLKWWDSTWLNEGFARLIEHIGTDVISDGNMKMKSRFVFHTLETAFIADSDSHSHPLTLKIDKSTELSEAFSHISYEKGASILNMIRALMGEDHFNKGINSYLTIHSYGSAEAEDLWAALNTAVPDDVIGPDGTKLDVAKFARQWTDQMGYPYVIVEYNDDITVKVTQKRYKSNPKAEDTEKYANPEYGFKWDVPVWYKINDGETKMEWLKRDEPLYLPVYMGTVVLNDGSQIFHRTHYDTYNWERILLNLRTNHLMYSNLTRYRLVSDAFAMTAIGEMKYEQLFDLLEYFKKEEDYLPWTTLENGFAELLGLFGSDERVEPLKKFYLELMEAQFENTNADEISENYLNDTYMYENLQSLRVFSRTCDLNPKLCDIQMESLWQGFVVEECKSEQKTSECVRLAAPLRALTYCYGVRIGDELTFNQMMSFYRRESVQVERNSLMASLACTKDRKLLEKLLYLAMDRSNGVFRLQDSATVFESVAKNTLGRDFIFDFLLEHWEQIHESFKSHVKILKNILKSCTSNIRTESQYEQLETLCRTAKNTSMFSTLTSALEEAKSRIDWIKTHLSKVTKIAEEHIVMD